MTSSRYETYVKRVTAAIAEILNLQEWKPTIKFDVEKARGDIAEIYIDDTYLEYTIELAVAAREEYWNNGRIRDLAEVLAHELCHIFTQPLYILACDGANEHTHRNVTAMNERQTQRITRVVMALLPKKVWAQ